MRSRSRTLAHDRQERRELREDQRAWPESSDVAQLVHQQLDFRGRRVRVAVDERRMARGLAQAQQRFEDVHARLVDAAFVDAAEERGAVVIAQLLVLLLAASLPARSRASVRCAPAARARPAPSSGAGAADATARERIAAFGRRVLRGERARERSRRSEQAGIEKLEQAPELAEVVLDRRAAEGEAMTSAQEPARFRHLARRVLDRLRFVEDHVLEFGLRQASRCRGASSRTSSAPRRRRRSRSLRARFRDARSRAVAARSASPRRPS